MCFYDGTSCLCEHVFSLNGQLLRDWLKWLSAKNVPIDRVGMLVFGSHDNPVHAEMND